MTSEALLALLREARDGHESDRLLSDTAYERGIIKGANDLAVAALRIINRNMLMKWVSVKDQLPIDGQAVLVRRSDDNWQTSHTLADGSEHLVWRWQAAKFRMTKPWSNNPRGYAWDQFGPGQIWGHEVSHWAAITNPLEENADA